MFHTTKQIWLVVEPHRWSVLDNSSSTAPLSAPQCFEVRPSNHVWIRSQSWYQRMQCGYNNVINHLPVTSSIVGIVNHSQSWVVYGIVIPTLLVCLPICHYISTSIIVCTYNIHDLYHLYLWFYDLYLWSIYLMIYVDVYCIYIVFMIYIYMATLIYKPPPPICLLNAGARLHERWRAW